jgi:nitrous oxidase accessory protein
MSGMRHVRLQLVCVRIFILLTLAALSLAPLGRSKSQAPGEVAGEVGAGSETLSSNLPAAPASCQTVPSGSPLQSLLDATPEGQAVCLSPGTYAGPISVHRSLTLWGPRTAVIQSSGEGSTIDVQADHVALLGFTVHGSGNRFDRNDCAIHVHGSDVRVEGARIEGALFGLIAEQSHGVIFRHNEISGDPRQHIGLRGDAIRVWETTDTLIEENLVTYGRDILIWYSSACQVVNNSISGSRYATHFMYSRDAVVRGNRYLRNIVGVFLMYSHGVRLEHNFVLDSSEEGMGIGIKDSDDLFTADNLILRNPTGVYVDASPAAPEEANVFARNLFAWNATAVLFHASEANTSMLDDSFRSNQAIASVEGNGDAMTVTWRSNYFDDYAGYDFNRDDRGDVPYELRSFSDELTAKYPELSFLRGSPALGLLDLLSHAFPLLQPRLILRDPSPRMDPPHPPEFPSAS